MRLYLSGGGSGKQNLDAYHNYFKVIDKEKPILYIPLAMQDNKYDSCYEWFKKEISMFGSSKFKMVKSSEELSKLDFNDFNSLFIGGGNAYKLIRELKEHNNIKKIKDYLKNNGIIYGGSAGAIIFGKDIDCCQKTDEKLDVDTSGFNYINDYSLLCHYNHTNYKKTAKYLKEYSQKNKVLFLPEEAVLLITNHKITIIGNHKYVLWKKGKSYFHNSSNLKKDINDK